MTAAEDMAVVVQLAALTSHRTPAEQAALARVAQRTDREINRQVSGNPHVPDSAGDLYRMPPCNYSADHDKTCVCRGDGVAVEPRGGWSRLSELVTDTQEIPA